MPRSSVKNDGPHVLIVEDNRDIAEYLVSILGADHQVTAVGDGREGLQLAQRRRPELIISDLVMPHMSGLELLRAIRKDDNLRNIPFILLTARGNPSDRRDSDASEADAFLPKPFLAGDLRPIVARLLARQGSQGAQMRDASVNLSRIMAAGIAHDILNPTGFIKNALFFLKDIFAQMADWAAQTAHDTGVLRKDGEGFIASAQEGVDRIIAAVEELRRFGRGESIDTRVPTILHEAIERVITMTRPQGLISTEYRATQRPKVRAGQLEQVLLNLVLNAVQAGGNHCRIRIETRDDDARKEVVITVTDEGPGIDAATLAHIFDPYFTTKHTGTGLGLTMCRQILRDHGGRLEVDSAPKRGTTFTLVLPFPDVGQEVVTAGQDPPRRSPTPG